MLHNTTRETLLQAGKGYTALVIDALYSVGFKEYQTFSAIDAINALKRLKTPLKAIRAGLMHHLFSPRGRRHIVFTMPAASTARKHVGGADLPFRDELPETAYSSLSAYRQALHHALIKRRPGIYKRFILARRLGVCKQTTRNYDRRAGHKVTEQSVTRDMLPGDLEHMATKKARGGRKPSWLVKLDADGWTLARAPMVRGIALKWLSEGFKVGIATQTANLYEPNQTSVYTTGDYSQYIVS